MVYCSLVACFSNLLVCVLTVLFGCYVVCLLVVFVCVCLDFVSSFGSLC